MWSSKMGKNSSRPREKKNTNMQMIRAGIILSEELPGSRSKRGHAPVSCIFSLGERTPCQLLQRHGFEIRSSTNLCDLGTVTEPLCVSVVICEMYNNISLNFLQKNQSALNNIQRHTNSRHYFWQNAEKIALEVFAVCLQWWKSRDCQ